MHSPLSLETPYCRITLNKKGASEYTKISFPLKYGIYSEIETKDAVLQFNLNHEIVRAKGKYKDWIQPSEWLKRSMGNDWIYYSTGGYTGVFEAIGEYYLPNLQYPTNSLIGGKPFQAEPVKRLLASRSDIIEQALESVRLSSTVPFNGSSNQSAEPLHSSMGLFSPKKKILTFLEGALKNCNETTLESKARRLFEIAKGRVTVMPPDARHVDYDIIPLAISQGCLYKCRFCRIKTDKPFRTCSHMEIDCSIASLKQHYGRDIVNYNGIFLGDHDALNAGEKAIVYAATTAYDTLQLKTSYMEGDCSLFMFGSVDSLMNAPESLFDTLNRSPYQTFINVGLESADQETLDRLGKPLTSDQVTACFQYIQQLNRRYDRIEITANFIMDDHLPTGHYPAFLELVREGIERPKNKGSIYLSPLRIDKPSRSVLFDFNRLKTLSRLPTYLYIIQRL